MNRNKINAIILFSTLTVISSNIISIIYNLSVISKITGFLLLLYSLILSIAVLIKTNYDYIFGTLNYQQFTLFGAIGLGFNLLLFTFTSSNTLDSNILQLMNWMFYFNLFMVFILFYLTIDRNNTKIKKVTFALTILTVFPSILISSIVLTNDTSNIECIYCFLSAIQAIFAMILINNVHNKYSLLLNGFSPSTRISYNPNVAMVIPAHNEEKLIQRTLSNIPKLVQKIYVVNDASTDSTSTKVKEMMSRDHRISLINHFENKGVGGAIISGYINAYEDGYDIFVVIGGDAQMEMEDLQSLIQPIVKREADYTKGNRFIYKNPSLKGNAFREMPKLRIIGNILCSIITIIASGRIGLFDSQMGYTAIHRNVIPLIDWTKARQGYGYPGDWLCRLDVAGIRIQDVPTKAIYFKNERQTQIKVMSFLVFTSYLMLKAYLWRIYHEYFNGISLNKRNAIVLSWLFATILFTIRTALSFIQGFDDFLLWGILGMQTGLYFILSDLTNNDRSIPINGNTAKNLKKLIGFNNTNVPDFRLEDLHVPRGKSFRNPFLRNHFSPQDTNNLFSLFYKATVGSSVSSIQKDHYPIAKMVHFMIAEENLTKPF
ncbi:MAG: glycosyltransferase [Promethearchaeota archaeon]